MISFVVSSLFSALSQVLTAFLSFLPGGGGFPSEIHSAASLLGGYAASLNAFLPVDTLFYILLSVISLRLIVFVFSAILTVVGFIRGVRLKVNSD